MLRVNLEQIAAQLMLKADDTKSLWESAVSNGSNAIITIAIC
jgi:hypothetical protein